MSGTLVGIARKPRSRAPLETLEAARVSTATGLEGDIRGKVKRRQITVMAEESWQTACAESGATLPWTARRANLLVRGLALPRVAGARFAIGSAVLEITEECGPCTRMDEQHQGLTAALRPDWRGGVACRVVGDGEIKLGDPVSLVS